MSQRTLILGSALGFILVLGFLTVYVAIDTGPDVLTFISVLVLGMFIFGIVGALREQPPDER
jgi:hypothetical protein